MELVSLLLDKDFSRELKEMVKKKTSRRGLTTEDSILHILEEFYQFHKDAHASVEREFEPIESLLGEAEKGITDFHSRSEGKKKTSLGEGIELILKKNYSD